MPILSIKLFTNKKMVHLYRVSSDDKKDMILQRTGGEGSDEVWTVLKGGSSWGLPRGTESKDTEECSNGYKITFEVEDKEIVLMIYPNGRVRGSKGMDGFLSAK